MKNQCVVGYSPAFYDHLQAMGYREVPEAVSVEDPDSPLASLDVQYVNWERIEYLEYLTNCMIGVDAIDPDYRTVVESLYEAIDDDDLRIMVEEGSVIGLIFAKHGYYIAYLE